MPGWPETLFILVVVVLLFGAKKLPELARGLGQSLGEFKKARDEFEREVRKSSAEPEVKEPAKPENEIAAVINVLSRIKPDIVGLIEIGDESMLDDLQSRLRAAGLDYSHREWVKGADDVRHICLLSK